MTYLLTDHLDSVVAVTLRFAQGMPAVWAGENGCGTFGVASSTLTIAHNNYSGV